MKRKRLLGTSAFTRFMRAPEDDFSGGGGDQGGARADIAAAMDEQNRGAGADGVNPGGAGGPQGGAAGVTAQQAAAFAYPQHWPDTDRQLFDKVSDAEIRKALVERFGGIEKGYQPKLEAAAKYQKRYGDVETKFAKLIEGLEGRGTSVAQYFEAVVQLEQGLMNPDPSKRVETIRKVAQLYGIDLAQLTGGGAQQGQEGAPGGGQPQPQPNQDLLKTLTPLVERLNRVEGTLTTRQQQEAEARITAFEKQIEDIATEKDASGALLRPHFEAVADDIIALVQVERAAGREVTPAVLSKLYERAVWSRDDLRDGLIKDRDAAAEKKRLADAAQKAKEARRAGVSLPASSGGAEDDESLRDTIKSAFNAAR
jgi:hypothetical protein